MAMPAKRLVEGNLGIYVREQCKARSIHTTKEAKAFLAAADQDTRMLWQEAWQRGQLGIDNGASPDPIALACRETFTRSTRPRRRMNAEWKAILELKKANLAKMMRTWRLAPLQPDAGETEDRAPSS